MTLKEIIIYRFIIMELELKKIIEIQNRINEIRKTHENMRITLGFEVFRSIKEYDNYEISNFGNVKNKQTGRVLKPGKDTNGYYKLNLYKNGKIKKIKIHRLVAIVFIDNPLNKPCVDHIDNQRTNNNLSNLRWVTNQQNSMNSSLRSNNTSGIKGVIFDKQHQKWRARIMLNNKYIHIGLYNTLEEAKIARQKKANELFGEFMNQCEV